MILPILAQAGTEVTVSGGAPATVGEFFGGVWRVWLEGGWVMIPLGLLAVFIYYEAAMLVMYLNRTGVGKTPRETWQGWLEAPEKGTGHIGETIRYVLAEGYARDAIIARVAAARQSIIPSVNQKIVMLSVLVTVAPLMGLLGTVIGMLTTFKGLAASAGQTIDLVAEGIRVALITTQTGLMIAIPGYIFISQVVRKRNQYNAFLATLESSLVQRCSQDGDDERASA